MAPAVPPSSRFSPVSIARTQMDWSSPQTATKASRPPSGDSWTTLLVATRSKSQPGGGSRLATSACAPLRGRPKYQASPAANSRARASTGVQGTAGLLRVGTAAADTRVTWAGAAASACANSAAVANRSAGSFSSARNTAASMCAGMVCRRGIIGRGDSVTTWATIACAVEPVNGGSPVSISYSTQPSAYMSERPVISRSPMACSGLM